MKGIFTFLFVALFSLNSLFAQQTVGLQKHTTGSLYSGYVLFSPMGNTTSYLMDKCGKEVHSWVCSYAPGLSTYILPDGNLLRPGVVPTGNNFLSAGGAGGIIQKIDWSGKVVWSYKILDSNQCQHHDIEPMPNGHILVIVWQRVSAAVAISMGRDPSRIPASKELWGEKIMELEPVGTNGANIVWEWNAWDHLIQDYDSKVLNYGPVGKHPERIDLNHVVNPAATQASWLHMNCIKYNADLDQILVSPRNWSEFWIIDHSTTTAQAATHTGGAHNRGGDLLYRWGNPATYRNGTAADQKFFLSHDPNWIPKGLPNAGKIIIFNNGSGRPAGVYSSVEIVSPAVDSKGNYDTSKIPYGPANSDWIYTAPKPTDFYSDILSSAQMLSNGNVLICAGVPGHFFEIDKSKNVVWDYISPVKGTGPVSQGTAGGFNVFRCNYYPANYAGFSGHTLSPGSPIELNPIAYACNLSGIEEIKMSNNFSISNPFNDMIMMRISNLNAEININLYDLLGHKIQTWTGIQAQDGQALSLNIDKNLKQGMYLIECNGTNIHYATRLVKQ